MALDHYVSQVHLKNFISPEMHPRIFAIRKTDQKRFAPLPKDICRANEHSTNSYIDEERIIEEFLQIIEPSYNYSVASLMARDFDQFAIMVISAFASIVQACSPAGMRISTAPIVEQLEAIANILDQAGKLPPAPDVFEGKSLSELLSDGTFNISADQKYTQAMGASAIGVLVSVYGNSCWDIMLNSFEDSPFFTSDFPMAIDQSVFPGIVDKIVPLTPRLAIRIRPVPPMVKDDLECGFAKFRHRYKKLTRKEVARINRLLVRCAESEVYFGRDLPWIPRFVQDNSNYRLVATTSKSTVGTGKLLVSSWQIEELNSA